MTMANEQDIMLVIRTIATRYPFPDTVSAKTSIPEGREIHEWTVLYRDLYDDYETLSTIISHDERQIASQFKKTTDARDYSLRHGYLRLVLGRYLHIDPALVPLVTGENGKPGIRLPEDTPPLSFSFSHSREMVALAVAARPGVGIDIVQPDERYPVQEMMDYLWSPEERTEMRKIPEERQREMFFKVWALKEALLKAWGGTAMMMRETDISEIIGFFAEGHQDPVRCRISGHCFFVSVSPAGNGHYCAIAACERHNNMGRV
ncbi:MULTISPECIES: 4'-phosphopantetheinyl transferase superfamily protein [unclassified Methanoregula]|uniref:4'-phosphopantetheinyl transferase family protein n=1 Tax=unclassified Methanoregula TaxID=2649730 RepID=UPI0009CF385A|nr:MULTISPECIES: 4'-phosphopantetheinyl transferase superfamily protein [unclassified Methanoregula]OPX64925.1 MAG: holo-(acyl carrier protein) synthase 2 [Methanoregula sp. PtaB.Bin085]OPY32977.1 MAG: holo-(acyl carrier protein) synthase 2 [Methanoregula sp. PtaU1.Bin006]